MMRALNTAGTGMVSQQMNLDIIANNLANVNTTAFKMQRAEFQDLMYQTLRASGATTGGETTLPQSAQIGLGSRFANSSTSFAAGSLQPANDPHYMAIQGEGFFQVRLPDGSLGFTRDGTFKADANGLIVTSDGYPLEPEITVPPGTNGLTIAPAGAVTGILPGSNEATDLGSIQVVMFSNPAGLTRMGQNLYVSGGASGEPQVVEPGQEGSGLIQQGFIEGSNVQVVDEMVKMIVAQRAYEINSKAIQTSDDMLSILNGLKR
ncbi:MAG: flagellar basal-body rod protein FlgG [Armatimonadetes bacterium]|nr:flagellar basal-body rod protein FlgG [Armatimonadota bacterium]